MLEVGAHEDQAAGAALAVGGGDAGLGAPDLAFEGFFPVTRGFHQLFFPVLELLLQGYLPGQKFIELLMCPSLSMVALDPQRGQF